MKEPLFNQLFHSTYEIEDFTTEILAGVLRSNQALLDSFVNKVLGIKGRDFMLETQCTYHDITIDMIFSNEDNLCFLENTFQAVVKGQWHHLKKCQATLETEQQEYSNVYLRYCSKYYDTQVIKNMDFAQFRLIDVCTFLESYPKNPLVNAFLEFLEYNNMKGITELNTDDLVAISTLHDTLKKMDECLDSIAAEFTMLFGYPNQGAPKGTQERLKLLQELNSYRMMKHDILPGGGGWSEITACFDYEKFTGISTYLAVWYWCDRAHNQYALFRDHFKQNKHLFSVHTGFLFEERPNGIRIIIQKPLLEFDSKPNALQAIHDWFVETLKIFRQFADKTPELNWDIPQS